MELVDSSDKRLNYMDIITIALQREQNKLPLQVALTAILKELQIPGAGHLQIGNTVFIYHRGKTKKDQAFFRALNADTPRNFLENSKKFVVIALRKLKLKKIFSQSGDPKISKLFYAISKHPPMPNMHYEEIQNQDGSQTYLLELTGAKGDKK